MLIIYFSHLRILLLIFLTVAMVKYHGDSVPNRVHVCMTVGDDEGTSQANLLC
jgi:hypothetical protein